MRTKKIDLALKSYASLMTSDEFLTAHKKDETSFTRKRKLPFLSVLTIILRKSVKSLQVILNEWCRGTKDTISASALSQARQKFSYTAFIELLEKCVVQPMYGDGCFKRYKGHRLLAVDGSTLRLPTSTELIDEFGTMRYMNGRQEVASDNVESKVAVLYDVLNEIPIAGSLHKARTNDLKASAEHLDLLQEGDILMADRGYGSYAFFAAILAKKAHFIVRIKEKTYQKYHSLFSTSSPQKKEVTTTIECPKLLLKALGMPVSLKIRFIRIELPDGEIEVLATSLLDSIAFPLKEFKKLYYKRWKIETFFQTIKSRLAVDNFTGRTIEAIRQDFYATLFVSGLETILSKDSNEFLAKKDTLHPQQVNKAISFHAIKDQIILLMFDPPHDFKQKLRKLFLMNPTLVRPNRLKDKQRLSLKSNAKSLYFQKFARKAVF